MNDRVDFSVFQIFLLLLDDFFAKIFSLGSEYFSVLVSIK